MQQINKLKVQLIYTHMNLKAIVPLYGVICNIIARRQVDLTIHISCLRHKTQKDLLTVNGKYIFMMILYRPYVTNHCTSSAAESRQNLKVWSVRTNQCFRHQRQRTSDHFTQKKIINKQTKIMHSNLKITFPSSPSLDIHPFLK